MKEETRSGRSAGLRWEALLVAILIAACTSAVGYRAWAQCSPGEEESPRGRTAGRYVEAVEQGLTCYPAQMSATEGRWTFLLRGAGAFAIEGGRLVVDDSEYPAARLSYPTPGSVLVDFEYPALSADETAELVVESEGQTSANFAIRVVRPTEVSRDRRQPNRVRVQLRSWTLIYPLHGFGRDRKIDGRRIEEVAGDEEFLGILMDLGIEKIRKVISRYAEDDSVHWDNRYQRENILGGKQLRQYLMFFDPERSEAAYKEIFLAFPQVEGAFVNEDRNRGR